LNIKTLLKALWWIIVLCFIAFFLYSNLHRVEAVAHRLPTSNIVFSLIALSVGKLLLGFIMYLTLKQHKANLSLIRSFSIYNITQLGKYIPGSIWQYVGKIGMYKAAGLNNKTIRDTILLEAFWVAFSAFLVGVFLISITQGELLLSLSQKIPTIVILAVILAVAVFLLLPSLSGWRTKLRNYWRRLLFTPLSLFTTLFVWLSLGLSFWMILIPLSTSEIGLTYTIGLFALSYTIGFVVPFAPAGIGIRESVLVLGLMPFLDIHTSIILATLNRVFYIIIEIVLAAASVLLPRHTSVDITES
jgi:hypothetical protein